MGLSYGPRFPDTPIEQLNELQALKKDSEQLKALNVESDLLKELKVESDLLTVLKQIDTALLETQKVSSGR